jgi:ribulose-phosphate 3-epimerase
MQVAPSILAADLADLRSALAEIEASGCELVHWDVMDGHFVPNLTFGPPVVRAARAHSALPFDVHLMTTDPAPWITALSGIGNLSQVSFQIEATHFAPRLCNLIRELGAGPSVALNPQTTLARIDEILELVANVLIMSVDPGFYGQPFIDSTYRKIERLAEMRSQRGLGFSIQVDGGVNAQNAARLAALGVDMVVMGKAYFAEADRGAFVRSVQSLGAQSA